MRGMSVALASLQIVQIVNCTKTYIKIWTLYSCLCLRSIVKHNPLFTEWKQGKENLGQKRLSDNTIIEFGATKDHG